MNSRICTLNWKVEFRRVAARYTSAYPKLFFFLLILNNLTWNRRDKKRHVLIAPLAGGAEADIEGITKNELWTESRENCWHLQHIGTVVGFFQQTSFHHKAEHLFIGHALVRLLR